MTDKKYRDELVQTIKDIGQEIINRAESMVHDDCKMITNFNISVDIPQPMDGPPILSWSTSVVSMKSWDRGSGLGVAEADSKFHGESVVIDKEGEK